MFKELYNFFVTCLIGTKSSIRNEMAQISAI